MRGSSRKTAVVVLGFVVSILVSCQETGDDERVSDRPRLSALVIVRPGNGDDVGGSERITSENVTGYAPHPEEMRAARAFFEAKGFEVFPTVALAFSIAGSQSLFEETFGLTLQVEMGGGTVHSASTEVGDLEMSLDLMPDAISQVVQTVTFEPPPEFGPTSFEP